MREQPELLLTIRCRRRGGDRAIPSTPLLVSLALAALASTGCYGYAPLETKGAVLPAGADLRVELTPVGSAALAALLGPRAVRLDGRLREIDSQGAIVLVPQTIHSMDGSRNEWSGDSPLSLRPDAVASVQERRFSRRRTVVAAGTVTAAAVAIGVAAVRWAGDKGGGSENPPPPPPP